MSDSFLKLQKNIENARKFAIICKAEFEGFKKPVLCDENGVYVLNAVSYEIITEGKIWVFSKEARDFSSPQKISSFLEGCKWISDYNGDLIPEDYEPYGIITQKIDPKRKPINPDA